MKKFTKNIVSFLLVVCCFVSVVGCGGNKITIKKLEESLSDGKWQFTVQENDDKAYLFEYILSEQKTYSGKAKKNKEVYLIEITCKKIYNTYLLKDPKYLETTFRHIMEQNPTGIELNSGVCILSMMEIQTAISSEYGSGAFTYSEMEQMASVFSGNTQKIENWTISSIIDDDTNQVVIRAELNK